MYFKTHFIVFFSCKFLCFAYIFAIHFLILLIHSFVTNIFVRKQLIRKSIFLQILLLISLVYPSKAKRQYLVTLTVFGLIYFFLYLLSSLYRIMFMFRMIFIVNILAHLHILNICYQTILILRIPSPIAYMLSFCCKSTLDKNCLVINFISTCKIVGIIRT